MTRPIPRRWSRFTHLLPYRRNNSKVGLEHAANNSRAVDLDVWPTADNVLVNTHWRKPLLLDGFRDPAGRTKRNRNVDTMMWRRVRRLESREGFRIVKVSRRLEQAAELGVIRIELDAKGGQWLTEPDAWHPIAELARELGLTVAVKCASRRPRYAGRVLRAAHLAGLPTILLPRGTRVMPKKWQPYIDYVRGAVIWR
ncbi:hypothetical protein ACLM5J_09690 [Nocardioides sp. Bht2]|uniref:hypothetical protein n=1 Tax=Nocardioides sp. Bht2 TaxID=3392297 RepID=UPI0039B6351D